MKGTIIDLLKNRNIEYLQGYLDGIEDLLDILPASEKIARYDIRKWRDEITEVLYKKPIDN